MKDLEIHIRILVPQQFVQFANGERPAKELRECRGQLPVVRFRFQQVFPPLPVNPRESRAMGLLRDRLPGAADRPAQYRCPNLGARPLRERRQGIVSELQGLKIHNVQKSARRPTGFSLR